MHYRVLFSPVMYLNIDVLFTRILNKEGKGILPHGVGGSIASLGRTEGKDLSCLYTRVWLKVLIKILR